MLTSYMGTSLRNLSQYTLLTIGTIKRSITDHSFSRDLCQRWFGIISLDASNRSKFLLMQSRSFESHSKNVLGLSSHFSVVLSKSILHLTFSSLDRTRVRPRRPPSARPRRSRRNGSQSKKRKRGSRRGGERKDRQSRGSPLLVCHVTQVRRRVGWVVEIPTTSRDKISFDTTVMYYVWSDLQTGREYLYLHLLLLRLQDIATADAIIFPKVVSLSSRVASVAVFNNTAYARTQIAVVSRRERYDEDDHSFCRLPLTPFKNSYSKRHNTKKQLHIGINICVYWSAIGQPPW